MPVPQALYCSLCGGYIKTAMPQKVKHRCLESCVRELVKQLRELQAFSSKVSGRGPIDPVTGENIY
jgi:hypothetical protein